MVSFALRSCLVFEVLKPQTNTLFPISSDIDDDNISEVSFPKGIPFVYTFDKNMNTIKPQDDELKQIHTNGCFLENPKLLEKALKTQKLWEQQVPGSSGGDLPNIAKRATTMEEALLKLRQEQESWAKSKVESSDKQSIPTNGDAQSSFDDSNNMKYDDRFEVENENVVSTTNKDEIAVNWSSAANPNDPIVVFVRHGRTPHNVLKLFTGYVNCLDGISLLL